MAEKNPKQNRPLTTPEELTTASPHSAYPSGDYSYTVELVARIENQLGKLTEAIDSLKVQTKDNSTEIRSISKDIHAAKVVGGFLLVAAGFVGWAISQLLAYLSAHPSK